MASVFRYILLAFLCSCSLGEGSINQEIGRSNLNKSKEHTFLEGTGKFQPMGVNRRGRAICPVNYEVNIPMRVRNELTLTNPIIKDAYGLRN
jgi:hypothetical protein